MDDSHRKRLEVIEENAKAVLDEKKSFIRDKNFFKRVAFFTPPEPIFIASSEDIGTNRVRSNHLDAMIDYCLEQEYLKKINAPI